MKGLGIILMVSGHAAGPGTHFLYLFHMAIFFMISGYLWDDKCVESIGTAIKFVKRKIHALWIPFSVANISYTLLNNLFIRLGIYTMNPLFLEMASGKHNTLSTWYSLSTICKSVVKNALFFGETQLGGATWFLRTLFIISVGYIVLRYVETRIFKKPWITAVTFIFACIMAQIIDNGLKLHLGLNSVPAAYCAFVCGIWWKRHQVAKRVQNLNLKGYVIISFSTVILLILNGCTDVDIAQGKITNIVFYLTATICGWVLIINCMKHMPEWAKKSFLYLGSRTIYIIVFHFLAFKVVSFLYLSITQQNMVLLASFPIIEGKKILWIPYLLVGCVIPIGIEKIVNNLKIAIRGSEI